jgi:WD40 repeat protein
MAIRSLTYDDINKRLISASDDLHINIIDESFKVIQTLVGHKDYITSIKYSEKYYYSASIDGNIRIWDNKKFSLVDSITINNVESLWDISVSNDDSYLLVGGESSCFIYKKLIK